MPLLLICCQGALSMGSSVCCILQQLLHSSQARTGTRMQLVSCCHALQVRWRFFDGAQFEIMTFVEGETLPDEEWQAPEYCFASKERGVTSARQ